MVTRDDILEQNLDLSPAVKDTLVQRCIEEAIMFELKEAINNDALYFDLEALLRGNNPLTGKWVKLYEAYTYTYNNCNYKHYGLKLALIYWSYSRFIEQGNLASTPFGLTIKTGENSQQATLNQMPNTPNLSLIHI